MGRKFISSFVFVFLLVLVVPFSLAADKVKLGTSIKMAANFYLPVVTAEERGFWKENGLEVEWIPFSGGGAHSRAIAARAVNVGFATVPDTMAGAERGLPVIMVAEMVTSRPVLLLVRADSPYQEVKDLKGKRIGVTSTGGTTHSLAQVVAAFHKIENDVRFVATGSEPTQAAALRAGAVDAIVISFSAGIALKLAGAARQMASTSDYMPKPWFDQNLYSRKDFAGSQPATIKAVIKASLQAIAFMQQDPRWTIDKIKTFQGVPEEAAKQLYEGIHWTKTGAFDRKAVENVRSFFTKYGILTAKAPPVDDLFSNEYLP